MFWGIFRSMMMMTWQEKNRSTCMRTEGLCEGVLRGYMIESLMGYFI